ncbi:YIP1 family protein [Halobaculum sp. CBA1158]|uniref:Yip1 family protein n=1 Tax=Halobaculum sp. CBA1158 TaxID=2904243 RepID=UPI001F44F967|nr:Yip1 family protein [Halobaculum sp. CBA1158]UIP00388.1 YIP1 family protein [Halobaculum sp. CBA1158]
MDGPRTPLLRPSRYFAAHDGSPPLAHAVAAVAVVTVATAGGLAVFLGEFAAALDVSITVDNPSYPGDAFCENSAFDDTPTGCGEPETVERNLGALVAEELSWLPPAAVALVPLFWVVQSGILHAASAVAGGDGPFGDTLAVVGWAMLPSLVRLVGIGAFVIHRLRTTTLPGDPEGALAALEAALAGTEAMGLLAAVAVAVWGGVIRTYGLAEARDHTLAEAAGIVVTLTVVGLFFELL